MSSLPNSVPLPPFDLILFGGTGDLARRKLLRALYYRYKDTPDPSAWRIISVGRHVYTQTEYQAEVLANLHRFVPAEHLDATFADQFSRQVEYLSIDATAAQDYEALTEKLQNSHERTRVFYLATAPSLFVNICQNLATAQLVTPLSRVVLEKPLGRDLASATFINEAVGKIFKEHQIYRIDHYLGKETVQNLLALRFSNAFLEPLWSREWVRDVQITIAETVGVEGRGEFYDQTGALRDMVQNHLLQLLCIVAMEPPASIDADAVRDEKLKVLRSLKPLSPSDIANHVVRGQYRAGAVSGNPVPGYLNEPGIPPDSATETFVALKAELANWRWAGVPFYLRTGKRMQERVAEIVVNFRDVPHTILPVACGQCTGNKLVIRLQPDESLKLYLWAKVPGDDMKVLPVHLNLDFSDAYKTRQWDAYERLIMDVIRGKLTLFMRRDELDAAWGWVEPILNAWRDQNDHPRPYTAGTWGPSAANTLVVRDGHAWSEE